MTIKKKQYAVRICSRSNLMCALLNALAHFLAVHKVCEMPPLPGLTFTDLLPIKADPPVVSVPFARGVCQRASPPPLSVMVVKNSQSDTPM